MIQRDARPRAGHLLSHVPVALCSLGLSQYHADTRGPLGQCGCHHLSYVIHVTSCHVMFPSSLSFDSRFPPMPPLFLSLRDSPLSRASRSRVLDGPALWWVTCFCSVPVRGGLRPPQSPTPPSVRSNMFLAFGPARGGGREYGGGRLTDWCYTIVFNGVFGNILKDI